MASRRHPVQAIAFASSDSPKLLLATAETIYAISATTHETVATWKAPPAPIQGKPQAQLQETAKSEDLDAAEALPVEETPAAEENPEPADVVMADSPPSASGSVAGKRKRSPSGASNPPAETSEAVETNSDAKNSDKKSKNKKKSEKRKAKNAAKLPPPPQPNYIGQLVPIPSRNMVAVTTLEDKTLRLLDLDTLETVKEWVLHKRPSAITLISSTILVGDKFGDVFSYELPSPTPEAGDSTEGKLLLGHVSLLTTLTTSTSLNSNTQNGSSDAERKYIITADRDEHIRITNYPLTHVIHGFCLGHTAFVNSLLITKDNLLVSGGGDDWLGLWDWKTGKLLQRVDIKTHVDAILDYEEAKALTEKLRSYNKRRKRREEEPEVDITIAVTEIIEVDRREILVVLEGVPAILRYRHTTDSKLEYAGCIKAAGSVTSLAAHGSRVYFGVDSTTGSLVSYVDIAGEETTASDFFGGKLFEGQRIEENEIDNVNERLYTAEAFRKGFGGFMEDD